MRHLDDRAISVVDGARFFGGDGADCASLVADGSTFKAGPGPDTAVHVWPGSVFNGARGDDRITGCLWGSVFHGGPGVDSVRVLRGLDQDERRAHHSDRLPLIWQQGWVGRGRGPGSAGRRIVENIRNTTLKHRYKAGYRPHYRSSPLPRWGDANQMHPQMENQESQNERDASGSGD